MSRILIKFPTRSRHAKFHNVLQNYIDMATNIKNIQIVVSVDDDDSPEKYKKLHSCVSIFTGKKSTKIDAINRDIPDPSTFDILLLASDDMIPVKKGYDDIIRSKMSEHFPDGDGVVFFNDGYAKCYLNTLVICGSKYYQRFGYIYYPEYKSFFCDNEFMDQANKLGKQIYFHDVIIKHEHPANNSISIVIGYDELYKKNSTYFNVDKELYFSRRSSYDLSILICTIPSRTDMFVKLFNKLHILKSKTNLLVEILYHDKINITIGEKRNILVSKSRGTYCCFIDDDDDITDDYFSIIEESGLKYDCIQLNGMMFVDGKDHLPFYHSMKYTEWSQNNAGYYRPPNHLNPIKTSIVKQIGFPKTYFLEDREFSEKLSKSGLIQTEFQHDRQQYKYLFVQNKPVPKKTVQTMPTLRGFRRFNNVR